MNALSSVPNVITNDILNAKGMISGHGWFTLAKVLRLAQKVRCHSLHILNSLLYDNSLGEIIFETLSMDGHSCAVNKSLLSIAKTVSCLIKVPFVVAVLLLAGVEVSVSFNVHLTNSLILNDAFLRLEYVLDSVV